MKRGCTIKVKGTGKNDIQGIYVIGGESGTAAGEAGIYPNKYRNRLYAHGCYQDKDGNWYYFLNIDERTILEPRGMVDSEGECFYSLTAATVCELGKMMMGDGA